MARYYVGVAIQTAVFSSVFDAIFQLYQLDNKDQDALFACAVHSLMSRHCSLEMMFVAPRFRIPAERGEELPYARAIEELRKVTGEFLPHIKLQHVLQTYREICHVVADYYRHSEKQILLGADDLLPIFCFCLVYSNLPCAFSELAYMNDFILEEDINGEMGYILATLHTSLHVVTHFDEKSQ
jgi:hypothetical protein